MLSDNSVAFADGGQDAYSVSDFCQRHQISRSHFYNLLNSHDGPRVMRVGKRTLVSREAAFDWRRKRENVADGPSPVATPGPGFLEASGASLRSVKTP
jgi:predicted DNA-binding transcriptional regulator AlpA